ncbi:MAG: chromosome segregation SMC family protein [Candidatus Micrarchaeota archaeon]
MLYLKSMSIRGFKSIKSSDLLFSKGFTCIVGPNGSGKSNICDALLFGLGENALHRLRVDKLEGLINDSYKAKKGSTPKAYVKLQFDGDSSMELIRVASADGKSAFKLNGKHMTRQEVLEVLRSYKMDANETNTITQGEIAKLLELSPKERRELIEVTSGIKEFEDKKKEALKELDQVNIKIGEAKIMLNERSGFLEELAKEKEAAEKYISMSARIKALNYSVLVGKEKLVKDELEELDKNIHLLDSQKKKIEEEIKGYSEKISELGIARQDMTKQLTEGTEAIGNISRRLEATNSEIVKINVELEALEKDKQNASNSISSLGKEADEINSKLAINSKSVEDMRVELAKIKIPDTSSSEENIDIEEKIVEIEKKVESKEKEFQEKSSELAKIQADLYVESSRYESLKSEVAKNIDYSSLDAIKNEIEKLNKEIEDLAKNEQKEATLLSELRNKAGEIDTKLIELKEQRAMSRQGSDISNILSSKFSEKDGFFGKASKLLSYENEYAYAVEAAAGNRLEYFVVDSIETANKIIKYLRENKIGRATFIPLNDINISSKERLKELKPVIELVKFEKRFEKAFMYIFSDTYLIDDISKAKSFGLGHRYVTIEGDLVEQSGIVTGGMQKKLSLTLIEKMIENLSKEKESIAASINNQISKINELRKAQAMAKISLDNKKLELDNESKRLEAAKKELDAKRLEFEKAGKSLEAMHSKLDSLINSIESIKKDLNELKGERTKLYEESMALVKNATKSLSREERKRIEQERSRAEAIKIKIAELIKENELLSNRLADINKEIASKKDELKQIERLIDEKNARMNTLLKEKKELEEKIKSSGEANKGIYEKLEKIESEIAKLSNEQGKLSGESSNINSKLQEMKMRRSQLEVRLGDLRAEISVYANENIEMLNGKIEEMEREASLLSDKLRELGNVNLKAPEIYKEKEKDVAEAKSKVEMLESEREAILKMIEEIDAKKYSIFMETFNAVSKNFSKLYSYISDDKAELVLSDERDPFNSELLIKVKTKNNVAKRAESMSGGELSMLMLTLVFAIHMYKPSSIYIFDEIDAALDKENSKKLSQLLKQLSADSQFIVVSHNDTLISNADAAIGVAKVNGESKIFGLQVSSIVNNMNSVGDEKKQ